MTPPGTFVRMRKEKKGGGGWRREMRGINVSVRARRLRRRAESVAARIMLLMVRGTQ